MSANRSDIHQKLAETRRLRHQASEVLSHLLISRERSEARYAEIGKRDPIKTVTGVSAIDQAISSTREMIEQLDLMAADLQREAQGAASPGPSRITTRQ